MSAVAVLQREALIGIGIGMVFGGMWRYGSHFPKRATIDGWYDKYNAAEGPGIPVKRRTTFGVVAQVPDQKTTATNTRGQSYVKTE
mmetsp:Transcript_14226/g.42599  ORF Transcript_14226/g.42599 Transcript_14226/m.42599 type:complete len:86 (+) Transcript_14226:352-609(+)